MPDTSAITIKITPAELTEFCDKLIKRSGDINNKIDSLSTLESFISLYSTTSRVSDSYKAIDSALTSISEQCREALLQQNTTSLITAFKQCDAASIAKTHDSLSRNEFYDVLKTTIGFLTDEELSLAIHWCAEWMKQYIQLTNDENEHPDTVDLEKIDISLTEYKAMKDINRVLNP